MPRALPPPVQVRFAGLCQPATAVLAESLIAFGRWTEEHIATHLPVVVCYPTEISHRLDVLKGYLAAGGWPAEVPADAIGTVRAIVEQMMPRVEAEIARGVRLMAAAAIRDDGSRAVAVRDQALSIFLASKMLATARVLRSHLLVGEPTLDWGAAFDEMAPVYSDRLIYGLSFLAREPHGWAGWTDADLVVGGRRHRLFAPICPEPEETINVETLPPEDVRRLIIPQLLGSDVDKPLSLFTIRRLAFEPWETFTPDLVLRAEVFVDAETCTDHRRAKAYITKIAADRIVSRLQQIPPMERRRQLLSMTTSLDAVSFDVADQVAAKVPFD